MLHQVASATIQEHQWSRMLYLFATTRGAVPADWTGNRITLLVTALPLAVLGWLLLGNPARLLREVGE